jgi:hypothetical protein
MRIDRPSNKILPTVQIVLNLSSAHVASRYQGKPELLRWNCWKSTINKAPEGDIIAMVLASDRDFVAPDVVTAASKLCRRI